MAETIAAIASAVAAKAVAIAAELGIQSLAASQFIYSATYIATQTLIYAAPSLILSGVRPDTPNVTIRVPLKQPRPVRQSGTGRDRISGPYMFFESIGQYSYDVFAVHDGRIDAFEQWWLNDGKVTLTGNEVDEIPPSIYKAGRVQLYWRLGLDTETVYPDLVTAFPTNWPATSRGDGIASFYMLCRAPTKENFPNTFPNGLPIPSVEARLSPVFDPRDPAHDPNDDATWEWTENAALNFLFYMCFAEGGPQVSYERYVQPAIAYWKRAADVCDEAIPLKAGGTVARYKQGGMWTWDTAPSAVIGRYLDCFDGWLARTGEGYLILRAGEFYYPSISLTDEDVYGWVLNRGKRDEQATNEIIIAFKDPTSEWNEVQTDPWTNEVDVSNTGSLRSQILTLPWVQNNSQARRLGKRAIVRQGADVSGSITVDLFDRLDRDVLKERYLSIDLGPTAPKSLQGIVVEVIRAEIDLVSNLIVLDWIKADPAIDEWDAATEEGTSGGGSTPVPPEDIPAFTVTEATAEEMTVGVYRFLLTVTDPGAAAVSWTIRYRPLGGISWTEVDATVTDLGTTLQLRTISIAGGEYEVQAQYETSTGAVSDWENDPPDEVTVPDLS